jgi:hypothetical protein
MGTVLRWPSVVPLTVPLEELDGTLMLLRGGSRLERPEITAFPGLRIDLARVQPVFARWEFSNHALSHSCGAV